MTDKPKLWKDILVLLWLGLLAYVIILAIAAPAQAATIERSRATDTTVTTDMPGWMSVRLHYFDHGYFGNSVRRVCVKARPQLTTSANVAVRVGHRWSADTYRYGMGKYHNLADGTWRCKRTSATQRNWRVDDAWRWKGTAWGPLCIGSFCPWQGTAAAHGTMR